MRGSFLASTIGCQPVFNDGNRRIGHAEEHAAARELVTTRFEYHRVGHDRRPMTFNSDGEIAEGAAGNEIFWDVRRQEKGMQLEVFSDRARTFALIRDDDGIWRGRWEVYECMPIELIPTEATPIETAGLSSGG